MCIEHYLLLVVSIPFSLRDIILKTSFTVVYDSSVLQE